MGKGPFLSLFVASLFAGLTALDFPHPAGALPESTSLAVNFTERPS